MSEVLQIEHELVLGAMALPLFHALGAYAHIFWPLFSGRSIALFAPNHPNLPPLPTPKATIEAMQLTNTNLAMVVPQFLEVEYYHHVSCNKSEILNDIRHGRMTSPRSLFFKTCMVLSTEAVLLLPPLAMLLSVRGFACVSYTAQQNVAYRLEYYPKNTSREKIGRGSRYRTGRKCVGRM